MSVNCSSEPSDAAPSRRWKALFAAAVFAGAVGFAAGPAGAVDATDLFELEFDADAVDDVGTTGDDWETLWDDCGDDGVPDGAAVSCGNSTLFTGIISDPSGVSIFGGGDKDIKDWPDLSVTNGSVPDKNELQHAFAAAYVCGAGGPPAIDCDPGDIILYFGADRDSHNGDAFLGFWFPKNDIGITNGFTGMKSNGDPLILVNFPQASNAQPIIAVVIWDDTCAKKDDNTPDPGECVATNLRLVDIAEGDGLVRCDETKVGPHVVHDFCASTNDTTQEAPWPYTPKEPDPADPDGFPFETFYEGGLNFTKVIGGECVATFIAESRSSSSFTAQLKDVVRADFPLCGINVAKACPTARFDDVGLCQDTGFTCDVDGDCSTGVCSGDDQIACIDDATCEAETAGTCVDFPITCNTANPQFVAGNDFVTQFEITIGREGPGILHDVRFTEQALVAGGETNPAGAACQVIAQDGSPIAPINLTFGTPVEVIQTFNTAQSTLIVQCVADGNVSSNRVIVDAKSDDSLADPDLGGPNTDGDFTFQPGASACQASPNPDIMIVKECLPGENDFITADIGTNGLEFTIPFKITVTNTGDEDLEDVNVVDSTAGVDVTFDLPAFVGNVRTIEDEYTTAFPDDPVGDEFSSGCEIMFTNEASVEAATGATSQLPLDVSNVDDSDTCPLCPSSCPIGG